LLKTPSYFRQQGAFQIATTGKIADTQGLKNAFKDATGLTLLLPIDKPKSTVSVAEPIAGQMEQNAALALVDAMFADKDHRPYKKGIKARDGVRGIELTFTTESLGDRYRDVLDDIERESRWPVWVSPAANQQELMSVASALLATENLPVKKLSFIPEKCAVRAALSTSTPDDGQSLRISQSFHEATGATIELIGT